MLRAFAGSSGDRGYEDRGPRGGGYDGPRGGGRGGRDDAFRSFGERPPTDAVGFGRSFENDYVSPYVQDRY